MDTKAISSAVIRRLPKYYRYITMIQNRGIVRISSQNLSEITGFTASQIRQDLNHFGGFGQQGYGYNVAKLRDQLASIIGLDRNYKVVVVGAGRMGQAICNSELFHSESFTLEAIFDNDPEKIGKKIDDVETKPYDEFENYLKEHKIDVIAITTPKSVAQQIANVAMECGVRGIWNYAPIDLRINEDTVLETVHLDESLHALIYYLGNMKDYKHA